MIYTFLVPGLCYSFNAIIVFIFMALLLLVPGLAQPFPARAAASAEVPSGAHITTYNI